MPSRTSSARASHVTASAVITASGRAWRSAGSSRARSPCRRASQLTDSPGPWRRTRAWPFPIGKTSGSKRATSVRSEGGRAPDAASCASTSTVREDDMTESSPAGGVSPPREPRALTARRQWFPTRLPESRTQIHPEAHLECARERSLAGGAAGPRGGLLPAGDHRRDPPPDRGAPTAPRALLPRRCGADRRVGRRRVPVRADGNRCEPTGEHDGECRRRRRTRRGAAGARRMGVAPARPSTRPSPRRSRRTAGWF